MVRWNAGTEHVKTQRKKLSPAGQKIEIQKKKTGTDETFHNFATNGNWETSRLSPVSVVPSFCPQFLQFLPLSFFPSVSSPQFLP
jgi:hypothetical protein